MASLPVEAKLGVPLREETLHHASGSANVNSPRLRSVKTINILNAVLGQEPWGRVQKNMTYGIRGIRVARVAS